MARLSGRIAVMRKGDSRSRHELVGSFRYGRTEANHQHDGRQHNCCETPQKHPSSLHETHRAADDCHALVAVLSRMLPGTSASVLSRLLLEARKNTHRVWAENSPFELKDTLKKRGYRWSDGSDGGARAWYADVASEVIDQELAFLRSEIYQREVQIRTRSVSAWERFSSRL